MENLILFEPLTAYLLDILLGEPNTKYHPVCWLGNTALFLEQKTLSECKTNTQKFICGIFCTCLLLLIFAVLPLLVFAVGKKYCLRYADEWYPFFAFFFASFILYLCIAPKSLIQHVEAIQKELTQNNMPEARSKLSCIVGRNTDKMEKADIIRTSIESLAENSLDSTLASFFWFSFAFLLFSYEGAVFCTVSHRIVNTLDAMWGKKNDNYLYFGKFPARFDDILNFIPARISFYLIIFSCFFIKECDYKNAYVIGKKFRGRHASPNSAWAEAPYAGALNLKLAGPVHYGDFFCDYPYLGEGSLDADHTHLKTALTLFQYSIFSSLIFYTFLLFLDKQ